MGIRITPEHKPSLKRGPRGVVEQAPAQVDVTPAPAEVSTQPSPAVEQVVTTDTTDHEGAVAATSVPEVDSEKTTQAASETPKDSGKKKKG
jgi:hypothetical protein